MKETILTPTMQLIYDYVMNVTFILKNLQHDIVYTLSAIFTPSEGRNVSECFTLT
jgi:hypothetical protein